MVLRSSVCLAALLVTGLVAGCASKPAAVPAVAVAAPPLAPPAPLPPGATPGMLVPAALADGSYPTPNQHVSAAATLWHLRAGLNVAALACPAEQGLAITAGYNALLAAHKAELKAAEADYAAEYRASGDAEWRDRYDDAMTRLYNFFSQTPVRASFCAAAGQVLAQASVVPAGGLRAFATGELSTLDRPFTDFYRAYDVWRIGSAARPVIAVSASAPATATTPTALTTMPAAITRTAPPTPAKPSAPPRLEVDLSALQIDLPSGS